MPRKGGVVKRPVTPDLKYNDVLVSRFINGLMERGKKSMAQCILYNAMEIVGQRGNDEPLKLFHQAVENVKPLIEVKSRRVGGATYQVPVEVRADRRVLPGHPLDHQTLQGQEREIHGCQAGRRTLGRGQQPGHLHQEAGRHA